MSLILFFIVLAILVLSHEFGHFIVAKMSGVRVDEFGFGFPPRLFSFKRGETEYSFNLIPFGGFVKIFGEEPEVNIRKEKDKGRSLVDKPKKIQAAVIVAGVLFNILLAWLLISTSITIGAPVSASSLPDRIKIENTRLGVVNVLPDSPAMKAGLKVGDEIIYLSTGEKTIQNDNLTVEKAQELISSSAEITIFIGYKRGEGGAFSTSVVPVSGITPGKVAIGVSLDMVGTLKLPFYQALFEGSVLTLKLILAMVVGLAEFVYGFFIGVSSLSSVSGPVGMIGIVGDASKMGLVYLLNMISLISINLAVLNMVPFPALDGGRLLLLFLEFLKGGPIDARVTNAINVFGFFILMGLMLMVTYSDVMKITFG